MMSDKTRIDSETGTEFVGHEWDGIEELDTPMPRWWVWAFYLSILWAIVYVILYPAWPLVNGATKGVLGWSSRGQLAVEMQQAQADRAPVVTAVANTPISELPDSPELMSTAIEGGRAAFKVHCVQCHGSGADGIRPGSGYPNLNDDEWLWGGSMADIQYTLEHGIRNPDHDATRFSQMPAFGDILSDSEIEALTSHVLSLSGRANANAQGATLYQQNCAICHGDTGLGDRSQGAPDLTDAIWLFGEARDDIRTTITNSRNGVMPRWNDKLDRVTIKMLSAYVWSLGGGEQPVTQDESPTTHTEGAETGGRSR